MKNLALACVLLLSSQAQAQIKEAYQKVKQTVTGSAKISQPHYFPTQWEALVQVGLTLANKDFKAGNAGVNFKTAEQTVNTAVTLGLTDFLSAGLNFDYDLNNKYSYDDGTPGVNYKGPADPTFNITGRAADLAILKIDLKLAYQPKIDNQKVADSTHDGNAYNGYRATTIGAELDFLFTKASQVFLSGDYSLMSEANTFDQTTTEVGKIKSRNSTNLKIGVLTEIVNDSFFGVTFSMLKQDGNLTTQDNGTSTIESPEINANTLALVMKHEFTPNSALDIQLESILNGKLKYANSETKVEGHTLSASYLVRF